jgi:hypothetical protein
VTLSGRTKLIIARVTGLKLENVTINGEPMPSTAPAGATK